MSVNDGLWLVLCVGSLDRLCDTLPEPVVDTDGDNELESDELRDIDRYAAEMDSLRLIEFEYVNEKE
jgi:hypothetical protein